MAFDRSKYRVQKVNADGTEEELDNDTFLVIRRDDVLGTATAWNYVANARLALALDGIARQRGLGMFGADERKALVLRAEGVAQLAVEWGEERTAKIPD